MVERAKGLLCDRVDLRDFSRIEECICGTAEGCADVEGEHKLSGGATIRCAVHREICRSKCTKKNFVRTAKSLRTKLTASHGAYRFARNSLISSHETRQSLRTKFINHVAHLILSYAQGEGHYGAGRI